MSATPLPVLPTAQGLAVPTPTGDAASRLPAGQNGDFSSEFSQKLSNILNLDEAQTEEFSLGTLVSQSLTDSRIGLAASGKTLPAGTDAELAAQLAQSSGDEFALFSPTADTATLGNTPILLAPGTGRANTVGDLQVGSKLSTDANDLLSRFGQQRILGFGNAQNADPDGEFTIAQTTSGYRSEAALSLADNGQALSRLRDVQDQLIRLTPENNIKNTGLENAASQIGRILERFSDVSGQSNSSVSATSTVSPLAVTESSSTLTSSNTPTQLRIDVPVGNDQWQRVFAERVVLSVDKNQSAQLRLTPAELGPIDISVNIDEEKTRLVFTTQHLVVKDQIEAALPRLREMLAAQGLELADVNVSHQESSKQDGTADDESGNDKFSASLAENNSAEIENPVTTQTINISNSAVDYFV